MKWIKRFVLISLMLLIKISVGLEQLPAELGLIEKLEPEKEDVLLRAVMTIESNCNSMVINHKENAVGILQIRPIMIKEVNRILTLQGDDRRFVLNDRVDSLKSVQVWYIVQKYHNPDYNPKRAARVWNGKSEKYGGVSPYYWTKVEKELNNLT